MGSERARALWGSMPRRLDKVEPTSWWPTCLGVCMYVCVHLRPHLSILSSSCSPGSCWLMLALLLCPSP